MVHKKVFLRLYSIIDIAKKQTYFLSISRRKALWVYRPRRTARRVVCGLDAEDTLDLRHRGDRGGVVGCLKALGLTTGRHPDLSLLVVPHRSEIGVGGIQSWAHRWGGDVTFTGHGPVVQQLGELGAGRAQAWAA